MLRINKNNSALARHVNPPYYTKPFLRILRNAIPVDRLITSDLNLSVASSRDGYLRFQCPRCHNFYTATNPETNLARCFDCNENFNPIDLVLLCRNCSFIEAIRFLIPLLPAKYKDCYNL